MSPIKNFHIYKNFFFRIVKYAHLKKNLFLLNTLKKIYNKKGIDILPVDNLNFNGDLLEAQAFAYLAIRCVRKLPLSLPTTTGVKKPTLGGIIYK